MGTDDAAARRADALRQQHPRGRLAPLVAARLRDGEQAEAEAQRDDAHKLAEEHAPSRRAQRARARPTAARRARRPARTQHAERAARRGTRARARPPPHPRPRRGRPCPPRPCSRCRRVELDVVDVVEVGLAAADAARLGSSSRVPLAPHGRPPHAATAEAGGGGRRGGIRVEEALRTAKVAGASAVGLPVGEVGPLDPRSVCIRQEECAGPPLPSIDEGVTLLSGLPFRAVALNLSSGPVALSATSTDLDGPALFGTPTGRRPRSSAPRPPRLELARSRCGPTSLAESRSATCASRASRLLVLRHRREFRASSPCCGLDSSCRRTGGGGLSILGPLPPDKVGGRLRQVVPHTHTARLRALDWRVTFFGPTASLTRDSSKRGDLQRSSLASLVGWLPAHTKSVSTSGGVAGHDSSG